MNLNILIPNILVPSETYMISQIKSLVDSGHSIRLVSIGEIKDHELYMNSEYPVFANAECFRLPNNDFKKIKELIILMYQCGLVFSLKSLKLLNWFKYKKQATKLYLIYYALKFKHETIDSNIVSHFGHVGRIIGILMENKLMDCSHAVFFHGYDFNILVKMHGPTFYDELFKSNSIILPVSNYLQKKLVEIGSNPMRTYVHRVTPFLEIFNNVNIEDKPNNEILNLVTVARLIKIKGIKYSIEAMQILKERNLKFNYTIIGDGPERKFLENLVLEKGLEKQIKFLGQLFSTDIKSILFDSDIFILPSIIDEGGPISLQEAILSGVLTIGTDLGGIPELIKEDGMIVEPKSAIAIAEAVIKINQMQNKNVVKMRAIDRIKKEFDLKRLNDKLISYFK